MRRVRSCAYKVGQNNEKTIVESNTDSCDKEKYRRIFGKTKPDTRLPQSRACGQGPSLRSLEHFGRATEQPTNGHSAVLSRTRLTRPNSYTAIQTESEWTGLEIQKNIHEF